MPIDFTYSRGGTVLNGAERPIVEHTFAEAMRWVCGARTFLRDHRMHHDADVLGVYRRWLGHAGPLQLGKILADFVRLAMFFEWPLRPYRRSEEEALSLEIGDRDEEHDELVDVVLGPSFFEASTRDGMTASEWRVALVVHAACRAVLHAEDFAVAVEDCEDLARYRSNYARANAHSVMRFAWEFRDARRPPTTITLADGSRPSAYRYMGPHAANVPKVPWAAGAAPKDYSRARLPDLRSTVDRHGRALAPVHWRWIDLEAAEGVDSRGAPVTNQGWLPGDGRP